MSGKFIFNGDGDFGLILGNTSYRRICYSPLEGALQFFVPKTNGVVAEYKCVLESGKQYSFTYIMEGSVGIFYIDGHAALSVRIYGANNEKIGFYSNKNAATFTDVKMFLRSKTITE